MNSKKLKILLVDDDNVFFELLNYTFESIDEKPYELDRVDSYNRAIEEILNPNYDAYLFDYYLNGFTGLELLKEAKKLGCKKPIIILTAQSHPDQDTQALEAGASDYLNKKDISIGLLDRSIRYSIKQKNTENELKMNEELLRNLLYNIKEYSYIIEFKRGFVSRIFHSPQCYQITGYDPEDFFNDPNLWIEIVHPDDRDMVVSLIENSWFKDEVIPIENRIIHKDGSIRWVTNNMASKRDTQGELTFQIGLISDITDKKKVQEELQQHHDHLERMVVERTKEVMDANIQLEKENEERKIAENEKIQALNELNLIFNSSNTGMCIIDNQFNIKKVNQGLLNLLNLTEEGEVLGQKCYEVFNESTCDSNRCPIKFDVPKNERVVYEMDLINSKGVIIPCIVNVVPFYNNEGKKVGILKNITDISKIKRLEKEVISISEKERQQISQDMHDELGQIMTGISFRIEALKNNMKDLIDEERIEFKKISELVNNAIVKMRSLSRWLNPVQMETNGLEIALKELVIETSKVFNIKCEYLKEGYYYPKDYSEAVHLYYIAKESINNAIKHGKAQNIKVYLGNGSDFILRVYDNGLGVTVPENEDPGIGMRIMKYRSEIIGAHLELIKRKDGYEVIIKK